MYTNSPFKEEHNLLRESFRSFLAKEVTPFIDEWEAKKECPTHIFKRMGEEGYFGVTYGEEYEGSGMDFWAAVVIAEEMARANMGGLAMSLYAHTYLPLPAIESLGTPTQKEKYLLPALKGQKITALGVTEPGAGSDVGGIQTTFKDMGDHYLLNGSKTYITNGNIADFVLIAATNGNRYQLTLFLVDTNTPGFSTVPIHNKMGMHSSDTAQIFLEDCKIPKDAVLGEEQAGFYYIMNNFQEERLLAAVTSAAVAKCALDKARQYVLERKAFGKSLAKLQVVRHKIAKMAIDVELCQTISYKAISEFMTTGPKAVKLITMAKAFVTEATLRVIHEAQQLHGGAGYMEDYGLARMYRDARLFTVGGGATEVMHDIIGKLELDDVQLKFLLDVRA